MYGFNFRKILLKNCAFYFFLKFIFLSTKSPIPQQLRQPCHQRASHCWAFQEQISSCASSHRGKEHRAPLQRTARRQPPAIKFQAIHSPIKKACKEDLAGLINILVYFSDNPILGLKYWKKSESGDNTIVVSSSEIASRYACMDR